MCESDKALVEKRQKLTLSIKRSRSRNTSWGKSIAQHPATANVHIIATGSITGSTRAYNLLKDLVGDIERRDERVAPLSSVINFFCKKFATTSAFLQIFLKQARFCASVAFL